MIVTTHSQTVRIIVGESILMGIIGGGIGFLTGLGAVVVIVTTYGFSSFGVSLNLWAAAWASMQPALVIGVIGLIAAPAIAALAACFVYAFTRHNLTVWSPDMRPATNQVIALFYVDEQPGST
jgi:hypothetical protein